MPVPRRVAIATCSAVDPDYGDDPAVAAALVAAGVAADRPVWDDPAVDWDGYDLVVLRSTWDYYVGRVDEFVRWAERVGPRLQNSPPLVRWNSDKRYLAELAGAGLAVVPTTYLAPGEPVPTLVDEVVVKPANSAGAIDTGRFGPTTHHLARRLVEHIHARGDTVMLQPYLASVDTAGETAVVCIDGEPSHALRKGAVLRPDEVAPRHDGGTGVAEAMFDPDLVRSSTATDEQLHFARQVVAWVAERFGAVPLYARVDMVEADDGSPVLMELEAVEPHLYLSEAPGSLDRLVAAILRRLPA